MRIAVRLGVIYNYNTNSEASPNPKKLSGAFQPQARIQQPGVIHEF
jgi:hypothetical protein